jgi:hypothetical protein
MVVVGQNNNNNNNNNNKVANHNTIHGSPQRAAGRAARSRPFSKNTYCSVQ